MVGYPESLTDPSYCSQILVLTYPLVGNYGICDESTDVHNILDQFESAKIWASALVVSDCVEEFSHWNAKKSLSKWLQEQGIPGISGDYNILKKIPFFYFVFNLSTVAPIIKLK